MATVRDRSAAYENFLLRVLPAGSGVCGTCGTYVVGYSRCFPCNRSRQALSATADVVVPIALSVKGGQLAHELSAYKNSRSPAARRQLCTGLAAVLWRWLSQHERCVAAAVGVSAFPLVTTVPSTSGRGEEPLERLVGGMVGATRDRYRKLLKTNTAVPAGREPRDDRYDALAGLHGEPVLLVDDTWTTGGHAQSASARLKQSRAGPVAVVVIGRHFSTAQEEPTYRDAAVKYLEQSRRRRWDWDVCRLCDRSA